MKTDQSLLSVLGRANPVSDPGDLVGSDAANELARRKPDSVLDWSISGDDYVADGYRIRFLAGNDWEIIHKETTLGSAEKLTWAFSIVEHHRREAIRRRDLIRYGLTFVLAIIAGGVIISVVDELQQLYLWLTFVFLFAIALASSVRFYAALHGSIEDPYRRLLWWERRRRWRERIFLRR